MSRDVRVNENQHCLVMGKKTMEDGTRELHSLVAWAQHEHSVPPPSNLAALAHGLSCVTEVWPDDETT